MKLGPNERCPCGSGKKFKKCCRDAPGAAEASASQHTQADRGSAFQKLDSYVEQRWNAEAHEAFTEFWGRFIDREPELPAHFMEQSGGAEDVWFAFDRRLADGSLVIDHFLELAQLTGGERSFLLALRKSSLRLYEVVGTVPGRTMTLRDLIEETTVTVNERSASRSAVKTDCLAARVIPRGCSGGPELEAGVLSIPPLLRDRAVATVRSCLDEARRGAPALPRDQLYEGVPPVLHQLWASSIFEPAVPELRNTDGEELVVTRVSFGVVDERALASALDGAEAAGVTRDDASSWSWTGPSANMKAAGLASLRLKAGSLVLEANSVARGARARELLERLAGPAITHRSTTHEDLRRQVVERVTARALGREADPEEEKADPQELPLEVQESLVLQHYAEHYRKWIDEPVPALDGRTPRAAAKLPSHRPRVEELVRGIEGLYQHALKDGLPAYDPSWMWAELELEDEAGASHPPLLAHERLAERLPATAAAIRALALRVRSAPSFSEKATTVGEGELGNDLALQRALRGESASSETSPAQDTAAVRSFTSLVNFELHGRKLFWVDPALSYLLEHTDVEVPGGDLRAPFPSFAIVLTDRHALSLAERLLARRPDDPLRGQLLKVATVYVTEQGAHAPDGRSLAIEFALDALGADLPSLVRFHVPCGDGPVRSFLDSVAPRVVTEPPTPDQDPARGLLRLVLNAILYATSAGVSPAIRTAPARKKRKEGAGPEPLQSAESVYYLPGTIDLRRVRQLQELGRAPEGQEQLVRFLVRGHWRRAQQGWADQRLRWIEPYWKGPDLAAVIEKAYRLKA